MKFVALTLSLSNSMAWALSVAGTKCPNQFVGSIERIAKAGAPFSNQDFKTVVVNVTQVVSGEVRTKEEFSALVDSFGFQEGDQVAVSMRNGFLCNVKKI
ncbi:MAG: hypothetical protein GY909_13810 [Oligoflexia bacterium]|nr:hypothetical protein [Oligoflexia bacterium]